MKARITEIQKQPPSQINVLADFFDDQGVVIDSRVFTFPMESYEQLSKNQLKDFLAEEGRKYRKMNTKADLFTSLINQDIPID